jgi:hypothetical protein
MSQWSKPIPNAEERLSTVSEDWVRILGSKASSFLPQPFVHHQYWSKRSKGIIFM